MIDGSEKRNRQLAFELQNSHVCEKRGNVVLSSTKLRIKSPKSDLSFNCRILVPRATRLNL